MSKLYYCYIGDNNKELGVQRTKKLLKYMNQNKDKMIYIGDFIFDSVSLSSKIILSACDRCEIYAGHNCCCGNSYHMPQNNANFIKSIESEAVRLTHNEERIEIVNRRGSLTPNNSTRSCKEECIYSFRNDEGVLRCALHAKSLIDNGNPADYKPYTCSLFPIFAVLFPNNKIGFFSSTKETGVFSPYFYTLLRRFCVNYEIVRNLVNGVGVPNNRYYRTLNVNKMKEDKIVERYNPAYIEQERVLRYFVGDDTYEELLKLLK